MSLGSIVWGGLADRTSLWIALVASAGWLLVSVLLGFWFPIRSAEGLNLTPAEHWPEPAVQGDIDPDDGPVMVMIEYQVAPSDLSAFRQAIE
jgi:hypothetical protein